ncbi:hypothetical protein [Streptomyces sp. B6B3]|uniref:hypothetical protein n=1 Tax=Streptomyces sp. B6B3 TaxID=3153570 RepID=UPI00325C8DF8
MTAPSSEASAATAATGPSPDAAAPDATVADAAVADAAATAPIPAQASPDAAPVLPTSPVTPGQSGPLTIAADGSYAARLVTVVSADGSGGGWCPERWTLDGPEPYAVRLPGGQPEEPTSPVLPLPDGRVLIGRRADGRWHFSLLYPSGPDTGELSLGAVECERLTLLPPSPDGSRVYALVPDPDDGPDDGPSTALWLVSGGSFGPELVATLEGRCSGGAWLDREGRLLALDRTDASGRTRAVTVTVDAERGGPPTELLRIAEDSNDRLLLADPDSGLLLVRSDAPGQDRIGWGVLGSHRPVRFPEALHVPDATMLPFAVQPGQMLLPESCGVALRMTTAEADWVAVWRPQQRELQHLAAPEGWLAGTGRWTAEGELLLPYTTAHVPCGLARIAVAVPEPQPLPPAQPPAPTPTPATPEPDPEPASLSEATAPTAEEPAPDPTPDRAPDPADLPVQEPAPASEPTATALPATETPPAQDADAADLPVQEPVAAPAPLPDVADLPTQEPTPLPLPVPLPDLADLPVQEPTPAPLPDVAAPPAAEATTTTPAPAPAPAPAVASAETTTSPDLIGTPATDAGMRPDPHLGWQPPVETATPEADPTGPAAPAAQEPAPERAREPMAAPSSVPDSSSHWLPAAEPVPASEPATALQPGNGPANEGVTKPVPLQQAPLARVAH